MISELNETFWGSQFNAKALGRAIHFDLDLDFLKGSQAL